MDIVKLRGRMAELGVTQQDLADALGINATQLNHILKGRRPPYEGFMSDADEALDLVARANRAGEEAKGRVLTEARERVLAGEGVEEVAG